MSMILSPAPEHQLSVRASLGGDNDRPIGLWRHDFVTIKHNTAVWCDALPMITEWIRYDRPLVVRRVLSADEQGIPLGVPLPACWGKSRIAVTAPIDAVASVSRPPRLGEVRAVAPSSWQPTLDRIQALCTETGVEARVYGSLAWQWRTGLPYLSPRSDVDLLFPLSGHWELLADGLAAIEAGAPMRIDGEIMCPDGAAANWRELRARPQKVLVKALCGASLQSFSDFLARVGCA